MDISGVQASVITDRCVPPSGLGPSPSTLKLVLWCLRGLGAPGADLCIPASIIELRTCLSRRGARNAMACLREHGILTQTQPPAPNRSARYTLNYLVLADWLDEGDWEVVKSLQTKSNGGTLCRRTGESGASERGHLLPPSKSTGAPPAAKGAPPAPTEAPPAGDIKEEAELPELPAAAAGESSGFDIAQRELAAAAAGTLVRGVEDWAKIAKTAGHDIDTATQLGGVLVAQGITDRGIGRNALERIHERVKGGGVQNPSGLLRSILGQPGGAEPSKKSIARKRAQDRKFEVFNDSVADCTPNQIRWIEDRVCVLLEIELGIETTAVLMPGGRFEIPLGSWPEMIRFAAFRWEEIKAMQLTEAGS